MKTHDLKTWPEPFQLVWDGLKPFEIRKDDRGFEVGDRLLLREWSRDAYEKSAADVDWSQPPDEAHRDYSIRVEMLNGELIEATYTGRVILAEVICRTEGFGLPDGMCVLGIRILDRGRWSGEAIVDSDGVPIADFLDRLGTFFQVFGGADAHALSCITGIVGPANLRRQMEGFEAAYMAQFGRMPEGWPPRWLQDERSVS